MRKIKSPRRSPTTKSDISEIGSKWRGSNLITTLPCSERLVTTWALRYKSVESTQSKQLIDRYKKRMLDKGIDEDVVELRYKHYQA